MTTWLSACAGGIPGNEDYRCKAIRIARQTSASLSLIGIVISFLVIVVYKKFRFFTQRLVTYLLISCTFIAMFSLDSITVDTSSCVAIGFFRNFFGLSQLMWILCINIHLLVVLVKQVNYRHLEKVYQITVWGGSFVVSIIPLFGVHYGNAGIWCWIKGQTSYENVLRILCYYLWLILMVFGGAVIYIYIVFKVMQRINSYEGTYDPEKEQSKQQYKKSIRPLLFYPLINLFLASIPLANRIHNWTDADNPSFGLSLAHSITSPLFGFVNACLFLLNKDTLTQLHPLHFWHAICVWSKSTFTFTKSSADTREKKMDYTLKEEDEPDANESANADSSSDME